MKLSRERISSLSSSLIDHLLKGKFLVLEDDHRSVVTRLEKIMTDELMIEDRLNQEVRDILKDYENEIDRGNLDYQKLFQITKKQLVKERGIIL